MEIVIGAVRFALFLFMMALFARVVLSLVISFARDWRPTGVGLVATEGVYTVTDPPIKAIRRVIPPVTIGSVRLDVAFLLVFIATSLLYNYLGYLG